MVSPRDVASRFGGSPLPEAADSSSPDTGPAGGRRGGRFRATAPYGLVALAETPMPAADLHAGHATDDLLRSHDRTVDGTRSGWIDLAVTTLTPTFVGQTPERGRVSSSIRFPHGDRLLPALPGSTLRGLVRNTVRMVTGGETGPVNTPMLFFRAPVRIDPGSADSSLSTRARQVMASKHADYRRNRAGLRTRQGFLFHSPPDGRWYVVAVPATALAADPGQALKVPFTVLRESLRTWDFGVADFPDPPRGNTYVPTTHEQHGRLQHRWVHAVHLPGERRIAAVAPTAEQAREYLASRVTSVRDLGRGGIVQALVVLTGVAAGERRNAYLFPRPTDLRSGRLGVPEAMVELFESAEQVTGYQRAAFPDGLGAGGAEPAREPVAGASGGGLPRRSLEPVWFDVDPSGSVVSFGRSGGYRIAVSEDNPIRRAVPGPVLGPQHGDPGRADRAGRPVDVCRALFGDTDTFAGEAGASKGRVSFGNALSFDPDPDYPGGAALRVRLLSPQRGCFANYLVQGPGAGSGDRPDIVTWSHEGSVRLGGYKVYLHRHRGGGGSPFRYDVRTQEDLGLTVLDPGRRADPPHDTQRDVVPLRDGLTFHSRITFTNLTDGELGALLRALLLDNPVDGGDPTDPGHAHKLGMGKSLGMGSVHLRPELYLVDRRARALDLDPSAGVARATDDQVGWFLDAFGGALAARRLPGVPRPGRWREVEQARDVCLAGRWRGRLPWEETAVMSLREFAEYPVLPPLAGRFAAAGPARGG
ncbi:TIGR03986 family CRISPR-associated RAMP protein [Nocardiopsis sp. CT-R113]|uniref:TIGR03986 family CRISPR-associated RAMP protein n=1 Tax=Nocardiopsis codii TaxID=3065942 RepID=A0ABU7KFX0_9ACTN|nr:TIGR03986 family CRISPR-associated RAMP protein [Nocardiopsis sp. CT-R113]MEE2040799.1 TIGR03986 family CRISPR-associated RAMP protein [Nocardiopsis sp. CT-R113]